MIKLLESIFGTTPATTGKFDAALIRRATDRLVEGTDPRLSAVRGYREKLRPAVEQTVEYIIELVDSLPPPADLAQATYLSDPRFRAFFTSVEHLREKVSASHDIRSFLGKGGSVPSEPVHALLAVRYEERRSLGMQLEGEIVRRDVMQQVVNFSDHQFLAPSNDEETTRWELKRRAYDNMVAAALARIVATQQDHHAGQRERRLLERKMRCLRDGCLGLSPAIEASPQTDPVSVEQEIARIEAELERTSVEPATLEDYLDLNAETLSMPEAQLSLQPVAITLDQMGRKVEPGSSPSARSLSLQEISIRDGVRAILLLVRIDPADITPPRDFIKEARRYLG